jgi:hypothetical protein
MLCPNRGTDSGVVDGKGSFDNILWKDQMLISLGRPDAYIL